MKSSSPLFTAIVLAGDRGPGDPLVQAAKVTGKALVPVNGVPMVIRALKALDAAKTIDRRILCSPRAVWEGQAELEAEFASHRLQWMEAQATPSLSAFHVLQSLPESTPVVLTTADHALLTSEMVEYFCTNAKKQACDLAVALAPYDLVKGTYPGVRRTAIRFRDGAYCTCNLFAFVTPASRQAANFWRRVERDRKRPWKVVGAFGWVSVALYLLGRLSLWEALSRASARMGFNVQAVVMPFPEAAVDVDTVEDWKFVEGIVKNQS